jgi:hypothetical protein
MDDREIARLRMRSQRLDGTPLESAEAAVGWMGAVQSQEYVLARWSIGQRARGVSEAQVEAMVADGRIVRTHILRPTWHYVLPADIRWMMALSGPRVESKIRPRYAALGLSDGLLQRSTELIVEALRGGRRMTRPQLGTMLGEAGIEVSNGRLAYVVTHAELNLVIGSGGLDGKQQTYALIDERVPESEPMSREAAVAELTRRYFTSHGPSSVADFTWWSGLTVRDARQGLDAIGSELDALSIDGRQYWFSPGAVTGRRDATPRAELIQTFDEYVVGYQATRGVIDVEKLSGPGTWNPNSFVNPLLVDGQIAGGWRRVIKGDHVRIATKFFRELNPTEVGAVERAVERYGGFLGVPATID